MTRHLIRFGEGAFITSDVTAHEYVAFGVRCLTRSGSWEKYFTDEGARDEYVKARRIEYFTNKLITEIATRYDEVSRHVYESPVPVWVSVDMEYYADFYGDISEEA